MKLFVGNLPYTITEDEISEIFSAYGTVTSVKIVTDRETGRPRGFGFVEMGSDDEANEAMDKLDGSMETGRRLAVKKANERPARR